MNEKVTKITKEEFMARGLEVTGDWYEFYLKDLAQYGQDLKRKGGIYHFHHEIEGSLYVGISSDLWKRLNSHSKLHQTGNLALQDMIRQLDEIILTVYMEPNLAWREIFENYLISANDPVCNVNKRNIELEGDLYNDRSGQSKADEFEQDQISEETIRRLTMYHMYVNRNIPLQEIAEEFGESPLRVKFLISQCSPYEDE